MLTLQSPLLLHPLRPSIHLVDVQFPCTSHSHSQGLHGTTASVGGGITEIKKNHVLSSTFGPTSKTNNSPTHYLKAGARTSKADTTKNVSKYTYINESKKPHVPTRGEKPIMGLRTSKNFITANAVEAILSVPQMPLSNEVDYIAKADFGKVPEYLDKVKEEIRRENDMIDEYVKRQLNAGADDDVVEEYEAMGEDERMFLINKLKTKWDAVNTQYQKISHRVKFESVGDIHKKESQESALKQLEDDIMTLQRAGSVMIQE